MNTKITLSLLTYNKKKSALSRSEQLVLTCIHALNLSYIDNVTQKDIEELMSFIGTLRQTRLKSELGIKQI